MKKMALLGLFIFGSLVILFAGVFVIGNQQRMFTRSYHLHIEFPTVSGLMSGAEVRIGGVRQGTVDAIRLPARPGEQVVVTISLDSSTRNLVKQDSIAAIETEGLLGNKFLAISFGSLAAPSVSDWGALASSRLSVDEKTGSYIAASSLCCLSSLICIRRRTLLTMTSAFFIVSCIRLSYLSTSFCIRDISFWVCPI